MLVQGRRRFWRVYQRACKTRQEGVLVFRVQMIERVRVCRPNRRRPVAVCLYVYACPFCASVDGHATRIWRDNCVQKMDNRVNNLGTQFLVVSFQYGTKQQKIRIVWRNGRQPNVQIRFRTWLRVKKILESISWSLLLLISSIRKTADFTSSFNEFV